MRRIDLAAKSHVHFESFVIAGQPYVIPSRSFMAQVDDRLRVIKGNKRDVGLLCLPQEHLEESVMLQSLTLGTIIFGETSLSFINLADSTASAGRV